jgi:hypothetical protein
MSRGLTVLLGLLALAGYQNRDKITEWLNAAQRKAGGLAQAPEGGTTSGPPGKLGGLGPVENPAPFLPGENGNPNERRTPPPDPRWH